MRSVVSFIIPLLVPTDRPPLRHDRFDELDLRPLRCPGILRTVYSRDPRGCLLPEPQTFSSLSPDSPPF